MNQNNRGKMLAKKKKHIQSHSHSRFVIFSLVQSGRNVKAVQIICSCIRPLISIATSYLSLFLSYSLMFCSFKWFVMNAV